MIFYHTLPEKIIIAALCSLTFIAGAYYFFFAGNNPTPELFTQGKEFFRVNINTAAEKDLQTIPYITPGIAEQIIEYRRNKGQIKEFDELLVINGIGPTTLVRIKPYLKIN